MSKVYHLSIEVSDTGDGSDIEYIASTYGDLDVVAYVERQARKTMKPGETYAANLVEVAAMCGDEVRTVAEITGDAEIVAYVLGKRIRAERVAAATPATPAEPTE